MRVTLTVTAGPHEGCVFPFEGHDTFLVGRSKKAHFQLSTKDRYFSRVHFLIEVNPPRCRLTDMNSRNGTRVNGSRVTTADLHDGDEIRAGKTVLRIAVETVLPATVSMAGPAPTGATAVPAPPVAPAASWLRPVTEATAIPSATAPVTPAAARAAAPVTPTAPRAPASVTPAAPRAPASVKPAASRAPTLVPVRTVDPLATLPPGAAAPSQPVSSCRACAAPVRTASVPLCPACEGQARALPQPLPGFRTIRELGRGGMGVVYLALRNADATVVAVKTITPAGAPSPLDLDRFLREATILRELQHPHIVRFQDMGEANGMLYFSMEYVRGTDANQALRAQGAFPVRRAVTLGCQLLEALEYAHARGFVHRDIKPGNLLLSAEGGREVVKVSDFGLARAYQASTLSGLTLGGDVGGTPAYMPPEQITNFREVQPAADQYSTAATLYTLLSGRPLFPSAGNFQKGLLMILHDEPKPLQSWRQDVAADLAGVIHKALAKEPSERFADARAMRAALAACSC